MIGPGKIIVILLVIEGPVLRIGHGCRRAHILAYILRIVEHLDLHRLMVTLFTGIVRTIVVLVPVLIMGAGWDNVATKRDDSPIRAKDTFYGRPETR